MKPGAAGEGETMTSSELTAAILDLVEQWRTAGVAPELIVRSFRVFTRYGLPRVAGKSKLDVQNSPAANPGGPDRRGAGELDQERDSSLPTAST